MAIVIFQAQQHHHRWADIGVIRPGGAIDAYLSDARSNHAKPGGVDIGRDGPMVPGKARVLRDVQGTAIGCTRKRSLFYICYHWQV